MLTQQWQSDGDILFLQEFGMFKYMENTRTFWFSHLSIELETEYRLVGSVLGLAIYNGVILDLHFPPVVYKKLLNGKPDFQVSYHHLTWPLRMGILEHAVLDQSLILMFSRGTFVPYICFYMPV